MTYNTLSNDNEGSQTVFYIFHKSEQNYITLSKTMSKNYEQSQKFQELAGDVKRIRVDEKRKVFYYNKYKIP